MRDRFRARVRDEIKQAALRQLADYGPQGLSLNAIAKQLGVSGPALYRYFRGRDELLTQLIVDAYADLADALADAVRRAGGAPASDRIRALAHAYRQWALAEPHRYRLLYAPPIPGYDAHGERLIDEAQRSMATLLEILSEPSAGDRGSEPSWALAAQLDEWARRRGAHVAPAVALRAVVVWARLHGLVSLEIAGNFGSMGLDADELFGIELSALVS
jgi:AcrR family transcriptional regulator